MCRLVHKQLKLPTPQRLLLGLSDDEIDGYIASGALVGVSFPAAVADQSRAVARAQASERNRI
jgi:hypothetical protein